MILSEQDLENIVERLLDKQVCCIATDTLYALTGDASSDFVIQKIYDIKQRDIMKPLSVFVDTIDRAKQIAIFSAQQEKILNKHWPGAYSFILPYRYDNDIISNRLSYNGTINIRIPKNDFLRQIINRLDRMLINTSANISDQNNVANMQQLIQLFSDKVDFIIDSKCHVRGIASRITNLSCDDSVIIRPS